MKIVSWLIGIILTLILIFGSIYFWNQNQEYQKLKRYQEKLLICQESYKKIVENKISLSQGECLLKKTSEELITLSSSYNKQYISFENEVKALANQVEKTVVENNFFREKLKAELTTKEVDLIEIKKTDLTLKLKEQKDDNLTKLKQFDENQVRINIFLVARINEFKERLGIFKELENDQIGVFLNSYKNKNLKDQVLEYDLLKQRLIDLNKLIENKLIELEKNNKDLARKIQITEFKEFTSDEFRSLYEKMKYDKVNPPMESLQIYELNQANSKVSKIAEARGYKKRPQAIESVLESIENQRLQSEAKKALLGLIQNASLDGVNLALISGYRSVEDQIYLFTARLGDANNAELIASGNLDTQINDLLATTAAPTYSRHHTGYTFDLGCGTADFTDFKNTNCYQWISKDNFYQVKKLGLIPSYPVGVDKQGPNPEAWEYVWVGADKLKK